MIVVADTSPIHYLLLIDQIDLLSHLFDQIVIPETVRDEMLNPGAPMCFSSGSGIPLPG